MTFLIPDASVAAKWYLTEAHSDLALDLLLSSKPLLCPGLLLAEVGNVLWLRVRRGDIDATYASDSMDKLLAAPLTVRATEVYAPRALQIAISVDRTMYDSIYVAAAEIENALLVSADERLVNGLRNTPFEPLICHLTNDAWRR